MQFTTLSLLYVEDDPLVREETLGILRTLFTDITACEDGRQAMALLEMRRFDMMIFDIRLPHVNGIELTEFAKTRNPEAQIIITSSYEEIEDLKAFIRLGVADYLTKPFSFGELKAALSKAVIRSESDTPLRIGDDVYYDSRAKTLISVGEVLSLTQNERLLLDYVVTQRREVLTYEEISLEVYGWKNHKNSLSAIRNLIYRLKKKIGFDLFESIDGYGYRVRL